MPKVSFVMPVYNSERYLKRAAESVLAQTFCDFELILVDDGSVDGSGEICRALAAADGRVRAVRQENRGISGARNAGLALARGEYVAFVDDDDECAPNLLAENLPLAEESGADLVKFGRRVLFERNGETAFCDERRLPRRIYERDEWKREYFDLRFGGVFSPVWDGLFRRRVIETYGVRFREGLRFGEEDTLFCLDFLRHAGKLALNEGVYYTHYLRIGHSISGRYDPAALEKYPAGAAEEAKLLRDLGLSPKGAAHARALVMCRVYPFLGVLGHPDCPLTHAEKRRILRQTAARAGMECRLSAKDAIALWKGPKGAAVLTLLYAGRRFGLLETAAAVLKRKYEPRFPK